MGGLVGSMEVKVEEEGQQVGKMRKIVPENYLQKEVEKSEIEALTSRVMQAGANQKEIDDVYEELVEVMKRGLVKVSRKKGERRQPWFSREMAKLRKVKAMCGIIQERLTQVVGERNLVAEEQGGFRRGRGCRNQLLTLMLWDR